MPTLTDRFDGSDGVIATTQRPSDRWRVTSGVLRRLGGRAWTGPPTASGSAVFRVLTRRAFPADARLTTVVRVRRLVSTERTAERPWDGVHLMLRRRSENELYYVSALRRDGTTVIKKKLPVAGGGRYVTLGRPVRGLPPQLDRPYRLTTSALTRPDGSVRVRLWVDGTVVADVVDRGTDGRVLRRGGPVGLRGDNADLTFDDVRVAG